ncbi:uncharacterized protein GGS25DRAFT_520741 [Hypoxylon fragiforme]|uniref:uncharacterized protein n=1 Tax=Hypoxylon fragiforme TaxID=63214 RepID=UPI0020C746B0|nr:uncharacterized protein GGS25DRAFT_520741 [Hypoxylon fragiforme]KAI2609936.1 hypothetical protein GGS25DRAFT_520741 [Hypoxylon fragiforme]
MSGVDNQNSEWTFGQVFSAIAWVPILVEIFVIVRKGPIIGLNRRLSKGYTVVSTSASGSPPEEDRQYLKL